MRDGLPRGSAAAWFIDGVRVRGDDLWTVMPSQVEGIEVYRGAANAPGVFQDRSGCGVVLVWTRRGPEIGDGTKTGFLTRRGLVAVGALVALIAVASAR
jgi:hypothetical protein